MNRNKIYGLDAPENNSVAANKKHVDNAFADKASKSYVDSENSKQDIAIADKASECYVDGEIAKIPIVENALLLDGSKAMTGDLKMGGKNIFKGQGIKWL